MTRPFFYPSQLPARLDLPCERLSDACRYATPELVGCDPRALCRRPELGPLDLSICHPAQAAIRARNYVFAADEIRVVQQPLSNELRVLDELRRAVAENAGHENLACRQLDR